MYLPRVKRLSNSQLYKLILTPVENEMPKRLKSWLKLVEKEFHSRDIKLKPIMNCDYR